MVAIGKVIFDVKLNERERKAIQRITGGKVLADAKLEVSVQVEVQPKEN